MKFIADFHLHSKYSRATSSQADLENLDKWAQIKGIKILGTGDFTHPEWFSHLREKLEPAEPGLFKLKNSESQTRFVLTVEISCIWSKGKKVRKVHIVVFSPSFEVVEKINTQLSWIGNLKADGRPILGLDAKELVKILMSISEDIFIVPAHILTPWFGIFGSKSGFDSLEECFEDYNKYIYALETGLSADPPMIWRLPAGQKMALISNSDAHSPQKIGREANVFNTEPDYFKIIKAIKEKDKEKFLYTIEFYPQEGKYHYDGHRNCEVCLSPQETKKYNGICPVCGKPLTIGVLNRVEKLANKEEGFIPPNAIPFKRLVPLKEIIGEALGKEPETKSVLLEYQRLIREFGNEFHILLNAPPRELKEVVIPEIVEGIMRVREGKVIVEPGYDGVFGKVRIFSKVEKENVINQETLF